jgi:O-succinylbenzoate synthase
MLFSYSIHDLQFKVPAKTSRNTLAFKRVYLLKLLLPNGLTGYGEISPFEGLSLDDRPDFVNKLDETILLLNEGIHPKELDLAEWPSISFGLEMAILDADKGGKRTFFEGDFTAGKKSIPINGLIWMAEPEDMLKQVELKISAGFRCIKLKIGALDFDQECRMLEAIRKRFNAFQVELRVDANGAFKPENAQEQLSDLSRFELHSIEQPIAAGQWEEMARLCASSPLDIALDEELLGISPEPTGKNLLKLIRPKYLILKPGLLGGFRISTQWIDLAEKENTGWWITSALESNLGLAAIAQFTAQFPNPLPQGLGTGQLYINNFPSPLKIENAALDYCGKERWAEHLSLS